MTETSRENEGVAGLGEVVDLAYPDLVARKEEIEARLNVIGISGDQGLATPFATSNTATTAKGGTGASKRPKSPKPSAVVRRKPKLTTKSSSGTIATTAADIPHQDLVPYREKIDTHWDYCMKEMMWLAADFQSERKRQLSLGRKLSLTLRQHFKTKESRKVRELAEAELKRRRLAGRITRELRNSFWTKIDRIVAYKQKLQADEERKKAMNQQLVTLVQQTERYGESITQDDFLGEADDELSGVEHASDVKSPTKRRKYPKLTIEQALVAGSASTTTRRSKTRVTDYSRMHVDDSELYGEATASEGSGSDDESYNPNDEDSVNWRDDETTLREAEALELKDRRRRRQQEQHDHTNDDEGMEDDQSFMADPEELRKLQEEGEMDIDDILERLRQEAEAAAEESAEEVDENDSMSVVTESPATTKRVHFAAPAESDTGEGPKENDVMYGGGDDDNDDDNDDDDDNIGQPSPKVHDTVRRQTRAAAQRSMDSDITEESGDEEEFVPKYGADIDDETTIEAEERLGRDISPEEEISLLERECEIPIEELRAMYAQALAGGSDGDSEGGESDNGSGEKDDSDDSTAGGKQSTLRTLLDLESSDNSDAYEPDEALAVDDETTIEAEEKLGRDMSYEAEIELLKRESEMSVEDLLAMYSNREAPESEEDEDGSDVEEEPRPSLSTLTTTLGDDKYGDDDEFEPDSEAVDDETTMEAEEKLGREMSVEDEIALLQRESEIPVEELLNQYSIPRAEEASDDDSSLPLNSKRRRDSTFKRASKRTRTDKPLDKADVGLTAISTLEASAERAKRTTASRPYLLSPWVQLREYQKVGLNWLVSLQTRRLNGILADEMGLGKTLQTIALLAYLASYKGIWGPHLVIVPTSVIVNWETEIKRFCPAFKVLCYYGSAKRRKELRSGWTKTNWYHIVVTSYQLAVQDAFAFKRKKWYFLILDESQNIKNFQSQRWQTLINFNSQRRLLLTGTPLQNNLMELWSLLHFLMPYIFRSRKEFSYWFSNPMNNMIEGNVSRNDDLINRLHGIIRPFVLRRLKNDVETQMPKKYEHIVKCQLSKRQMFLYEEFMARSSTRQSLRKGGNFMAMMNVLMQLRKVCNHPDLFEPRSIITPFVLEGLHVFVPAVAARALMPKSALDSVSAYMTAPIWCGSGSEPSLATCVYHDQLQALALRCSAEFPPFQYNSDEPKENGSFAPGLSQVLESLREEEFRERENKWRFQQEINTRRCEAPPFPYPSTLVDSITLTDSALNRNEAEMVFRGEVLSTPIHLLAMRKSQQQRADELDELMKKFVFCVPKAGAPRPRLHASSVGFDQNESSIRNLNDVLSEPLEECFRPYRKASARLSSFFPDKKLIQFDAGKLQTLSELLHRLKRGGHRALIFTQMSKMLDVLEAFLNLNGHTYLRLDGSTGVDRRQRLMDRFNNDTKVFCFILSTRSGGLGINLTGADTVIFYDSDWNPAMDAQAQDRAHRIGQTREVHIYRLITEHTIEENILIKAQQKCNLGFMVLDGGKFDASQSSRPSDQEKIHDAGDVYTKGGLRDILGIGDDLDEAEDKSEDHYEKDASVKLSKEQMEMAMAALEDEDDVRALRGAQKEAAEELKEFDESIEIKKDSDQDDEEGDEEPNKSNAVQLPNAEEDAGANENSQEDQTDPQDDQQNEQKAMEEEFAAWQSKVGLDASAIEASLGAVERYGLHFREEIDPFYSIFAIMEQKRQMEATAKGEEVDIDEIERQKAAEERRAIEEGDLLVTRPRPEDLLRQRNLYERERARLKATKKGRKLTGENWTSKIDAVTKQPFWYNSDTGEASWDKPQILSENEANELALLNGWIALPLKPLVHVMSFLSPLPDRMRCAYVCRQWRLAATDVSFVRHVYPAEMGVLLQNGRKYEHNHFRTIAEAVSGALPGDTIELGDGHYWVEEPGLSIDFQLRFVGDEHDCSHVIVELSGAVSWSACGGWMEGITFRRPKISGAVVDRKMLCMEDKSKIDMIQCTFDNEGGNDTVIAISGAGSKGRWESVIVRGGINGIVMDGPATLHLANCFITTNQTNGIVCRNGSTIHLQQCRIEENGGTGIVLQGSSFADLVRCHLDANGQSYDTEAGCKLTTSHTPQGGNEESHT